MLIFLKILFMIQFASSMNISPVPNIIFRIPNIYDDASKHRSSYFGFSVVLRNESVFVGAPRSKSMAKDQKKITEPGVIFKCSFNDENCHEFQFDTKGNNQKVYKGYHTFKKGIQKLGSVMTGGPSDSGLLVCAPNFRAVNCGKKDSEKCVFDKEQEHFYHGICYHSNDTSESQPKSVKTLTPLSNPDNQKQGDINIFHYGMAGFSSHITETNEILLGAPGVFQFRGSIFRYKVNDPTPESLFHSQNDKTENCNYFGYAVTSGKFQGKEIGKISLVASVPRRSKSQGKNSQQNYSPKNGTVVIFDLTTSKHGSRYQKKMLNPHVVEGTQFGEYFGYTLLSEDFNNDGFDDLAVSAPLYSVDRMHDNGAVYVFINKGDKTRRVGATIK
jgi:hypothetical protein